jgi:putrescine transport system permease protein
VRITLPLSKNGIIAGSLLVFIPAVGEYVIPELLGGADTLMIGRVMWDEFFNNMDWPMASAVTVAMVLLLLVPMAMFQYYQARNWRKRNDQAKQTAVDGVLAFGFCSCTSRSSAWSSTRSTSRSW